MNIKRQNMLSYDWEMNSCFTNFGKVRNSDHNFTSSGLMNRKKKIITQESRPLWEIGRETRIRNYYQMPEVKLKRPPRFEFKETSKFIKKNKFFFLGKFYFQRKYKIKQKNININFLLLLLLHYNNINKFQKKI